MRISIGSSDPLVDPGAWVAPGAVLSGAVVIERGASVWFGAVLRADGDAITIGENANVQDGVIVHADPNLPVTVSSGVSVGHGAVLHGCTVGKDSLVGMRAVVLNGSRIGAQSLVAAGAVVLEGSDFEPRSLIAGVPAKRRRELTEAECRGIVENANQYLALSVRYGEATHDG